LEQPPASPKTAREKNNVESGLKNIIRLVKKGGLRSAAIGKNFRGSGQ